MYELDDDLFIDSPYIENNHFIRVATEQTLTDFSLSINQARLYGNRGMNIQENLVEIRYPNPKTDIEVFLFKYYRDYTIVITDMREYKASTPSDKKLFSGMYELYEGFSSRVNITDVDIDMVFASRMIRLLELHRVGRIRLEVRDSNYKELKKSNIDNSPTEIIKYLDDFNSEKDFWFYYMNCKLTFIYPDEDDIIMNNKEEFYNYINERKKLRNWNIIEINRRKKKSFIVDNIYKREVIEFQKFFLEALELNHKGVIYIKCEKMVKEIGWTKEEYKAMLIKIAFVEEKERE